MNSGKNILSAALITALVSVPALSSHAATVRPGKTVMAVVNGKNITANDVTTRLWGLQGMQALNELILEKVMTDKAAELKINIPEERIDEIYKRNTGSRSEKEIDKELARTGWTAKDIRERIKNQLLINEVIIKLANISVPDEEVLKYYNASKDRLIKPETYNISQITLSTKEEAENVLDGLLNDRNAVFGAVAAEKSNNAGLRARAGLIGDVQKGQLPAEIESEIFALRPGQISKIMQTGNAFSIFRVNNISPSRQYEFTEVRDTLRSSLLEQKINANRTAVMNVVLQQSEVKVK